MSSVENKVLGILSGLSKEEAVDVLLRVSSKILGVSDFPNSIEEAVGAIDKVFYAVKPIIARCLALDTPSDAMKAWIVSSSILALSFCSSIVALANLSDQEKWQIIESLPDTYRDMIGHMISLMGRDLLRGKVDKFVC